ncbi:Kelch repeat-containing protein [Flavobacterium tyrosinilyticum]|uniref:Kelch repeat-containing protein n=1 Tax=Flavobacterium tyrosinilyticum TaxID=1658740 RepID=UPI00202DC101|nr:carboxypeptidase-like regulatory domain-containing protein [Flavobacterium tyrosinilyticum]MCM0664459.1 carboxypeptidase-like regulatory domain-containing protein [Flavobacterium tyrosinilyticum]
MKKLLYIVILLPFITNAQTISGIVKSETTNLPIEDANIYALRAQIGTITNDIGEFSLSKAKASDTLQVSHIGYLTAKIAIADFKKSNFIISLKEDIETLNNIEITNRQAKLKSKLDFIRLESLNNVLYSFGSTVVNGKIYIIGGDISEEENVLKILKERSISYDNDPNFQKKYLQLLQMQVAKKFYREDLLIYDTKTDVWEKSNTKFKRRAYHNVNCYNNTLYVLGGKRMSTNQRFEYLENEIEVFDINKNSINIDKTNPHMAADFASFVYKDNIIVMGGSTKKTEKGEKTFTDKVHMYNITSGLWYELEKMPVAKEVKGVLIGDKIFTVGNNDNKSLSEIQSFDLTNETWKNEATLISHLENPAIAYNVDDIYLFEDGKLSIYNTKSKQIKEYFVDLQLRDATMHLIDNKLYILGGYSFGSFMKIPSSKVYSISIDEFDTTAPNRIRILSQNNVAQRN